MTAAWNWDDLTGKQLGQIHEALLDAFSDQSEFGQFLTFELDIDVNQVATGNYRAVVFDLVKWTNAKGRIRELVEKARAKVPLNARLRELGLTGSSNELSATPIQSMPEGDSENPR